MARNRKPLQRKTAFARAQRQALIPAEKLLWRALRNRAAAGFKFRRQHPIGPYVVDFASVEVKLIVEVDGESHLTTRHDDTQRSRKLESEGWFVLRFWNTEIYADLEAVMEAIYRVCVSRAARSVPPSPPAPLPPPVTSLQTTSRTRRGERGDGRRLKMLVAVCFSVFGLASVGHAQAPSYSKDIRPFLAKYCVECHNPKTLKGTLDLDSYKALMAGADAGPVVKAGKPDESKLVRLIEHKDKPTMPPPKAKFQPTKDEIKLLRAWVQAGALDDGASVKVELPALKAKAVRLAPVTALAYSMPLEALFIVRGDKASHVEFHWGNPTEVGGLTDALISAVCVSAKLGKVTFVWSVRDKGASVVIIGIGGGHSRILDDTATKHTDTVLDLVCHDNGLVATSGYDGLIQLRNKLLKEHSDAVYGLAFNPDGTLLASVSADRALKVWDVDKGKLLYTLGEATDWLYTVAWSPDGKYVVTGGVDKSIRVYEAPFAGRASDESTDPSLARPANKGWEWKQGAKLRQSVFAHEGPVQKLLFSSDSKTLYSLGQDRVVKAWDIEKMVERKVYDKQPETVLCMALREDAGQIILGRYDGIVQLIDMKTGKVVHEFERQQDKEKGRQGEGEKQEIKPRDERSDSRGFAPLDPQDSPRTSWDLRKGVLDRAGAVYSQPLDVKSGQAIAVQVVKDSKSKLDPVLTITDALGRIVAESYEGHLGHTFKNNVRHSINLRDREYRGGADFTYELKVGEFPVLTEIFPMGVERGTTAEIRLTGVFLPKQVVSITVPKDAKIGARTPLPIGAGVLGKAEVVVGEYPNVTRDLLHLKEPPKTIGTIPVPATANGQLRRDGEVEAWSFKARKSQPLVLEVNARRLGSRLDSIIEILDSKDQPVPRAVLHSQAKTHVTFRDHDSAQGNIRIEAWSELGINDYLFVGNELMKIQALPTHPDADCNFFQTAGQRIGYLDTTPTHHANNTPMYKVVLHPPGMTFPPNGYPVFTLYYKNDDGGPGFGRDSRLIFDPPADGEYRVRIADARGMGGVNFGYRLTAREPRPLFKLQYAPQKPVVSKGGAIPVTITVERIDGFDGRLIPS